MVERKHIGYQDDLCLSCSEGLHTRCDGLAYCDVVNDLVSCCCSDEACADLREKPSGH